jgi:hypothetical protein
MKGLDPVQDEILVCLKHIRSNTSIIGVCVFLQLLIIGASMLLRR